MKMLAILPVLLVLTACGAGLPQQPVEPAKQALPAAPPPPPMPADDRLVCPADVQACPDGSFVSRNPAKGCAFDACPAGKK